MNVLERSLYITLFTVATFTALAFPLVLQADEEEKMSLQEALNSRDDLTFFADWWEASNMQSFENNDLQDLKFDIKDKKVWFIPTDDVIQNPFISGRITKEFQSVGEDRLSEAEREDLIGDIIDEDFNQDDIDRIENIETYGDFINTFGYLLLQELQQMNTTIIINETSSEENYEFEFLRWLVFMNVLLDAQTVDSNDFLNKLSSDPMEVVTSNEHFEGLFEGEEQDIAVEVYEKDNDIIVTNDTSKSEVIEVIETDSVDLYVVDAIFMEPLFFGTMDTVISNIEDTITDDEEQDDDMQEPDTEKTVWDEIRSNYDLQSSETLLQATGNDQLIKEQDEVTVFLPSNKAFDNLSPEERDALFDPSNTDMVNDILSQHIILEQFDFDNPPSEVTTVDGTQLKLSKNSPLIIETDTGQEVEFTDEPYSTDNGDLYVIDEVLFASDLNIDNEENSDETNNDAANDDAANDDDPQLEETGITNTLYFLGTISMGLIAFFIYRRQ